MKLTVISAICGAIDITEQWFSETIANCADGHELILVSNGNTLEEDRRLRDMFDAYRPKWSGRILIRDTPLGSTGAYNLGLTAASGDVVAMLHNDLMVREPGWDTRIIAWFNAHPETGVVGFHGSRELGHPDIYRIPYELHQLARGDNWSNLEDAEAHGQRTNRPMEVVTVDGMALIARYDLLMEVGGLYGAYGHHMYDHHLCLEASARGFTNYVLPISARHLSGQTANFPRWNDALKAEGIAGDQEIHRRAHELFYEHWRGSGMLPARLQVPVRV